MPPFPVCVIPPGRVMAERFYVFWWNGEVWQEGWVARPEWMQEFVIGADGGFYFARIEGADGSGITLYRSSIAESPVLETVQVSNIDLPTDLDDFASNFGAPHVVLQGQQAAIIGVGQYSYTGEGTVSNGVVYSASSLGVQSFAEVYEDGRQFGLLNAAIEFEDGSFAACEWGITS